MGKTARIKTATGAMSVSKDKAAVRQLMEATLADNAALRATVAALVTDVTALATAVDVLAAKLNLDAGVTDENYAVTNEAAVTATAPAALTLLA